MKAKILIAPDGDKFRWIILVWLDGAAESRITPQTWKPSYKKRRGAISAARRVAEKLGLECEE